MNSERWDGGSELQSSVALQDVKKALKDPGIKSVTLHKPGSVVERSIGGQRVKFRVNETGEWVVVSPLRIGLPSLEEE